MTAASKHKLRSSRASFLMKAHIHGCVIYYGPRAPAPFSTQPSKRAGYVRGSESVGVQPYAPVAFPVV